MKRLIAVMALLSICLTLFGCAQEPVIPASDKPGEYYDIIMYAMEKNMMKESELKKTGCDYYLKLCDDGTGEIKVDNSGVKQIGYDESRIWMIEDPETYVTYSVSGDEISIIDGVMTFKFRKR